MRTVTSTCKYTTVVETKTTAHWVLIGSSVRRYYSFACVIAQQYSPANLSSLRIRSSQEKFGTRFKNAHFHTRKAIPLHGWTGPDGSRRLGLPDFKTTGK